MDVSLVSASGTESCLGFAYQQHTGPGRLLVTLSTKEVLVPRRLFKRFLFSMNQKVPVDWRETVDVTVAGAELSRVDFSHRFIECK